VILAGGLIGVWTVVTSNPAYATDSSGYPLIGLVGGLALSLPFVVVWGNRRRSRDGRASALSAVSDGRTVVHVESLPDDAARTASQSEGAEGGLPA